MLFSLKYMGMTLVEQPKGEELSAAAVKRIVATVSVCAGAELCLLLLKQALSQGKSFRSRGSGGSSVCLWVGGVRIAGPALPGLSRQLVVWVETQTVALGNQPQPVDGAAGVTCLSSGSLDERWATLGVGEGCDLLESAVPGVIAPRARLRWRLERSQCMSQSCHTVLGFPSWDLEG